MSYDDELHAAWCDRLNDLAKQYRVADDGREVRDAWRALQQHIDATPASLPIPDRAMRDGLTLQRRKIDNLRMHLRRANIQVLELRRAIEQMRVAGGADEFQMAFDAAKTLLIAQQGADVDRA